MSLNIHPADAADDNVPEVSEAEDAPSIFAAFSDHHRPYGHGC